MKRADARQAKIDWMSMLRVKHPVHGHVVKGIVA